MSTDHEIAWQVRRSTPRSSANSSNFARDTRVMASLRVSASLSSHAWSCTSISANCNCGKSCANAARYSIGEGPTPKKQSVGQLATGHSQPLSRAFSSFISHTLPPSAVLVVFNVMLNKCWSNHTSVRKMSVEDMACATSTAPKAQTPEARPAARHRRGAQRRWPRRCIATSGDDDRSSCRRRWGQGALPQQERGISSAGPNIEPLQRPMAPAGPSRPAAERMAGDLGRARPSPA